MILSTSSVSGHVSRYLDDDDDDEEDEQTRMITKSDLLVTEAFIRNKTDVV